MTRDIRAVPLRLASGITGLMADVRTLRDVRPALTCLGLHTPRSVVVLIGGAAGLSAVDRERLRPLFDSGLVPVLERYAAVCIDGGTDAGVMALIGSARFRSGARFELVGVVAEGNARWPGTEQVREFDLERHHTHFLRVPGTEWGAESLWIARTATVLAGPAPSVTVLVNGGEVSLADVQHSIEAGRNVVVVAGSGRAADELDAAVTGRQASARAMTLVSSGLLRVVQGDDPASLGRMLTHLLGDESPERFRDARPQGRSL